MCVHRKSTVSPSACTKSSSATSGGVGTVGLNIKGMMWGRRVERLGTLGAEE